MKNTNFLPKGGPKIPLRRLSSLESMISCNRVNEKEREGRNENEEREGENKRINEWKERKEREGRREKD